MIAVVFFVILDGSNAYFAGFHLALIHQIWRKFSTFSLLPAAAAHSAVQILPVGGLGVV